jgi:hypothetical protein
MSYASPVLPSGAEQQFVDVDFWREAEDTGNFCGLIPDDDNSMAGWRDFEAVEAMIPRDQWKDLIAEIDASGGWLERRIRKIKNQGRTGMCVYFDLAQCAEIVWNRQSGDDSWIELSPGSGYRFNASSPGSGSNVGSSITWLSAKGLLPADTEVNRAHVAAGLFKHVYPSTGYYEKFPDGGAETARLFRADEFLRINTVEGWFTALHRGYPCSGGRDMHAICHCRPIVDGSSFLSMYANSWGNWGATRPISPLSGESQGFGFDSEGKVRTMVSRGAFCVRTMLVPPWLQR